MRVPNALQVSCFGPKSRFGSVVKMGEWCASMSTIGFGIVGLGRIGGYHAEQLRRKISGARLVAAAVDAEHRLRLEASDEAPCPLVEDLDALLATSGVDAVVIASPSSLHGEHIARAAEANKAVFSEKPLADSLEQARMVASTVRAAGIPFQIGFQRRFDPGYARAKHLIDEGAIGVVEMFRGISCDRMPPVEFLRTSGGLFWDLAIHDFDAARFLMGQEVVAVMATGGVLVEPRLTDFDDIDHGVVTLKFANGGLGVCQSAWRAPYGYDIRAEVHGTLGKVITEVDERFPTRLYRTNKVSGERHDQFTERFGPAYTAELQAFVDALQTGASPSPGVEDGLAAVAISDAATRSRRTSSWVNLV